MAMGQRPYIGRCVIYARRWSRPGVTSALEVIHKSGPVLALCGETSVAALGKHNLLNSKGFWRATGSPVRTPPFHIQPCPRCYAGA